MSKVLEKAQWVSVITDGQTKDTMSKHHEVTYKSYRES